jgi:hypothetical protein
MYARQKEGRGGVEFTVSILLVRIKSLHRSVLDQLSSRSHWPEVDYSATPTARAAGKSKIVMIHYPVLGLWPGCQQRERGNGCCAGTYQAACLNLFLRITSPCNISEIENHL